MPNLQRLRIYLGALQAVLLLAYFVTLVPGTAPSRGVLRVYTADVTPVQTFPVPGLQSRPYIDLIVRGEGQFVWTYTAQSVPPRGMIRVYRIGAAEPSLTFEGEPIWNAPRSAAIAFSSPSPGMVRLLDLTADEPRVRDVKTGPITPTLVAVDSSERLVYNWMGVILRWSAPRRPQKPATAKLRLAEQYGRSRGQARCCDV